MKVKAKFYKGIEFIHLSDLPAAQQILLQHTREPERIKILMEGKIVDNCIHYKEYCEWFSTVYKTSVALIKVDEIKQVALPVEVALIKSN